MKTYYDKNFYNRMLANGNQATNTTSANAIVPYILGILKNVDSVVDVGCGIGVWSRAFLDNGISDVNGLDGVWVQKEQLVIPEDKFIAVNLEEKLNFERKYDLAVSLEVAEHISPDKADLFVDNLVDLSDIILFSAAVPNQGGTHHVNEQWPSYWAEKFLNKGYVAYDVVRPNFSKSTLCRTEYVQNMILYVHKNSEKNVLATQAMGGGIVDYIHPSAKLVKSSQSLKYIFYMQRLVVEALVKKVLHKLGIRTKTV